MPKNITYGPKPDEKTPEPSDTASKEIPHTNIDTPAFATASGDEITYVGGGNELCPRGLFDGTITGAVREPHPTEIWDNGLSPSTLKHRSGRMICACGSS